jgi:hypothetical protein
MLRKDPGITSDGIGNIPSLFPYPPGIAANLHPFAGLIRFTAYSIKSRSIRFAFREWLFRMHGISISTDCSAVAYT